MRKISVKNVLILIIFLPTILALTPMSMTFKKMKKTHCHSIPKIPLKFKENMKSCQREVQAGVVNELFVNEMQKNPFNGIEQKVRDKLYFQIFRNVHQPILSPLIHHQNFKLSPYHQYRNPYYNNFAHHSNESKQNLHSVHDYQTIHHNPQEITYKYSEIPQEENENEFYYQKSEDPENDVEFASRDYHQQHVTEANYKYADEITTEDEDKNEIIEARDELMKILGPKSVVRRDINKSEIFGGNLQDNNGTTTRSMEKRSLLSWWTSSAERTGKNEQLEFQEEEKELRDEENLISGDERWLAGCLINCIFKRNGAIDRLGYPTLDGIVDMYTSGTIEQPFFMYTLRATNKCLKIISIKYKVNRKKKPFAGLKCTIAYEVFECVTDAVNAYCKS